MRGSFVEKSKHIAKNNEKRKKTLKKVIDKLKIVAYNEQVCKKELLCY